MSGAVGGAVRIGIVTVSDRASRGEYADRGGPAVRAYLDAVLDGPWEAVPEVVPDERAEVEGILRTLADERGCCLIVTTGGTGPAPRDVTPEATEAVCERLLPGLPEAMRAASRRSVPTAVLSRQAAGHRGRCLIVNLPGRPAAIAECLDAVWPAIPHGVALLGGPRLESPRAWRPPAA